MTLSPNWRRAFPYEDTRNVVTLVQKTWDSLVARKIPRFNPESKEPHLTEFLRSVLKAEAIAAGLTGRFTVEDMDADPDFETGELKNRSRADIRYFSDRTAVDLTFEFKKLNAGPQSRQKYYGENGVLRFVDGKYSRDKHLALMVGLISSDAEQCINSLKMEISKPKVAAKLHLLKSVSGQYVHDPSRELASIVRFDTEHSRAKLGNQPNIVLCHLFLLYGSASSMSS